MEPETQFHTALDSQPPEDFPQEQFDHAEDQQQQEEHAHPESVFSWAPYRRCPEFLGAQSVGTRYRWHAHHHQTRQASMSAFGQPSHSLVDGRRNQVAQLLLVGRVAADQTRGDRTRVGAYGDYSARLHGGHLEKANYRLVLSDQPGPISMMPLGDGDNARTSKATNPYFGAYQRNLHALHAQLQRALEYGANEQVREPAAVDEADFIDLAAEIEREEEAMASAAEGSHRHGHRDRPPQQAAATLPPTPPRPQQSTAAVDAPNEGDDRRAPMQLEPLTGVREHTITLTKRVSTYQPRDRQSAAAFTADMGPLVGPVSPYDPERCFMAGGVASTTADYQLEEFHLYDRDWRRLMPGVHVDAQSGRDEGLLYAGDWVECNLSLVAYRVPVAGGDRGHRQLQQPHTHRIKLRINCVRVLERAPPEPRLSLTPGDFVRLP